MTIPPFQKSKTLKAEEKIYFQVCMYSAFTTDSSTLYLDNINTPGYHIPRSPACFIHVSCTCSSQHGIQLFFRSRFCSFSLFFCFSIKFASRCLEMTSTPPSPSLIRLCTCFKKFIFISRYLRAFFFFS